MGRSSSSPPRHEVAVVVPFYRQELRCEERQSLHHLETFLGRYDRWALVPESFGATVEGFERAAFPDACFASVVTYSRLLLSRDFYRAFADYRYILVHQLDALVLEDTLDDWCRAGWDYLGAPWLKDPEAPGRGFSRVGNGGLSLRRVAACLEVLDSTRYLGETVPFWRELLTARLPDHAGRPPSPRRLRHRVRVLREARLGVDAYLARYQINEDRFWSDRAHLFHPGFRVAPVGVALDFAFERAPRYCFERHGHRLPFGCHAWDRFDRAFWEPHLIASPD